MVTKPGTTARSWATAAGICAVAGGALWLLKQVAVALLASGDGPPPEHAVIATFYLLGIPLMIVGASGIAARLLGTASPIVWIPVAVLSAPAIFFGVQAVLDAVVDAVAGPDAHWWWPSEGGIVLTALVFLGIGAALLRGRRSARRASETAALA